MAWAFGKVSGSMDALSSREGLKKGEESDASDEHDGGGSFDQSVDFQVSADWLLLLRSKCRRIEMKKSEYECCRRTRCQHHAADSKRFHFGSFAEDPTESSSGGQKKNFFRPKDFNLFSSCRYEKQKRFDISRRFLTRCCAESFEFELSQQAALLLLQHHRQIHSFILMLQQQILRMSRQLVLGRGRRTDLPGPSC